MNNNTNNQVVEISIGEILSILRERIYTIVLVTLLVVICGFLYCFYATPVYKSSISLYITPLKASSSVDDMVSDAFNSSSSAKIETEMQLITSSTVLMNALDSLDLTKYVDRNGESYSTKIFTPEGLANKVNVSSKNSTKLVVIQVTDPSAEFAADYANAIYDSYKDLLAAIVRRAKTTQREALDKQIPENMANMKEARANLLEYSNKYGTTEVNNKMQVLSSFIASIQLQKNPLTIQLSEIENKLNSLPQNYDINSILSDSKALSIYKDYKASSKEYFLYMGSAESSADERALILKNQLSSNARLLSEQIASLTLNESYASLLSDYLTVEAKIDVLSEIEMEYQSEISEYQKIISGQQELEDMVSLYQNIVISLNSLLEETKIIENSSQGEILAIDSAVASVNPYKPQKLKIMALSLIGGLFLGMALAVVQSFIDNKIYSAKDIKKVVDEKFTFVGWVPYHNRKSDETFQAKHLVSFNDPSSYSSERYRIIGANISLISKDSKVLVFNSLGPSEGKTSISANMAATYAIQGKKVLLIDADLRRPALEHFFGLKHQAKGLTSIMKGQILEECIVRPIDELKSLHLLPAGSSLRNPNIVFNSENFSKLITRLRKMYDYIIIDCPPISYGSDFMLISKHIDSFILLARAGATTRDGIYEWASTMKSISVPCLGYILNGVLFSSHSYGYVGSNYNYGYSYGYNYGYDNETREDDKKRKNPKYQYKKIIKKELEQRRKGLNVKDGIEPKLVYSDLQKAKEEFATAEMKVSAKPALSDLLSMVENDVNAKGKGGGEDN